MMRLALLLVISLLIAIALSYATDSRALITEQQQGCCMTVLKAASVRNHGDSLFKRLRRLLFPAPCRPTLSICAILPLQAQWSLDDVITPAYFRCYASARGILSTMQPRLVAVQQLSMDQLDFQALLSGLRSRMHGRYVWSTLLASKPNVVSNYCTRYYDVHVDSSKHQVIATIREHLVQMERLPTASKCDDGRSSLHISTVYLPCYQVNSPNVDLQLQQLQRHETLQQQSRWQTADQNACVIQHDEQYYWHTYNLAGVPEVDHTVAACLNGLLRPPLVVARIHVASHGMVVSMHFDTIMH